MYRIPIGIVISYQHIPFPKEIILLGSSKDCRSFISQSNVISNIIIKTEIERYTLVHLMAGSLCILSWGNFIAIMLGTHQDLHRDSQLISQLLIACTLFCIHFISTCLSLIIEFATNNVGPKFNLCCQSILLWYVHRKGYTKYNRTSNYILHVMYVFSLFWLGI